MKKLSNITESIWSDIQDRSSGEVIRKEDDVDLLDAQEFVEYLRDIYKNVDTKFYIFKDLNNMITVPTFETELGTKSTWFIEYDCNKKAVYIWEHFLNKEDKLFDKLNDNYKLTLIRRNFTENFLVEPKKGKSSNKFFIEIIDYILENASVFCKRILVKNNKVSESIWSDIQDRSSGESVRKEDDVDNLDMEGLKDYITKHYKLLNTFGIVSYVGGILSVPITKITTQHSIMYYPESKIGKICIIDDIIDNVDGLLEKLNTHFEIKEYYGEDMNGKYTLYYVSPKDGSEVTNKFFIEVIDFLLDNIPDSPNYKKSIEKIS